jgi:hypothetical protein
MGAGRSGEMGNNFSQEEVIEVEYQACKYCNNIQREGDNSISCLYLGQQVGEDSMEVLNETAKYGEYTPCSGCGFVHYYYGGDGGKDRGYLSKTHPHLY